MLQIGCQPEGNLTEGAAEVSGGLQVSRLPGGGRKTGPQAPGRDLSENRSVSENLTVAARCLPGAALYLLRKLADRLY
jgi:hypothetical protein